MLAPNNPTPNNSDLELAKFNSSFRSGWTKPKIKDRFVAAIIHFGLSLIVAFSITVPLVFWLYPSPYFEGAGGLNLLALILGIDAVIGPVLTFLIFDRAKKSLRKDLWVIALLQIAALVYGLYATAQSRPLFLTFVVDRYEMVSAADVDPEEFKRAPSTLKMPAWGKPELAYAEQPSDRKQREEVLFASVSGLDLNRMFRYYKPAERSRSKILERARPISELSTFNNLDQVNRALVKFGSQKFVYVPVQGKRRDLTALINADTGELIEVVDLKPWSTAK